jgi:hypothetical protein
MVLLARPRTGRSSVSIFKSWDHGTFLNVRAAVEDPYLTGFAAPLQLLHVESSGTSD